MRLCQYSSTGKFYFSRSLYILLPVRTRRSTRRRRSAPVMMMSNNNNNNNLRQGLCEIEEEEESSSDLFEIKNNNNGETDGSLFSYDIHRSNGGEEDIVYVAVLGKNSEDSSKDALTWTLKNAVRPSSSSSATTVYLIHIFPELHYVPTPLGKLPISQVNPEQKNNHMIQERSKRTQYLQKFLDLCSASKVKVETILIESDMEAKAILELIPILNINTLVVGTTKSSLRRLRAGRGSGIAEQILQSAPEFCEVKMICEGKQVSQDQLNESPRANSNASPGPSPSPSPRHPQNQQQQDQNHQTMTKDKNDSFTCGCFKPKVIS